MSKFALPGCNAAEATKETDRLSMEICDCSSSQSVVDGRECPLRLGRKCFLRFTPALCILPTMKLRLQGTPNCCLCCGLCGCVPTGAGRLKI